MEKAGSVPITQQVCATLSAPDQDEHCAALSTERYCRRIAHYRRAGLLGAGQTYEVERATTGADLEEAYRLVHQVYCQQGYIWPDPSGLRIRPFEAIPQMATFVVKRDGRIVAVTSVLPDSPDLGLPSDVSFYQELSALRGQGRRVCEITNLAVAAPYRNSQVFLELTRACLAHAQNLHADDLFIAIRLSQRRLNQFRNLRLGFVFQDDLLLEHLSALENVLLPARIARRPLGKARHRAAELLDRVGLGERTRHRPGELSGGQRQRVNLARALMNEPALLLADEPTARLDQATGAEIMGLLSQLNQQLGVTILLVTHERELASRAARVVEFLDGRIVADRPAVPAEPH